MAWFNRKVVTWTDQELKWIEENGKSAANASKQLDKNSGTSMAKWFDAQVLISQKYSIAFYNLPEETDAPELIRMLS